MGLFGPPDVDKLKAKGDVPGLIKALGYERDSGVRGRAADALVQLGSGAVEPLIVTLRDVSGVRRDGSHEVGREAAAQVLGKIGDARAIEPLIAGLRD